MAACSLFNDGNGLGTRRLVLGEPLGQVGKLLGASLGDRLGVASMRAAQIQMVRGLLDDDGGQVVARGWRRGGRGGWGHAGLAGTDIHNMHDFRSPVSGAGSAGLATGYGLAGRHNWIKTTSPAASAAGFAAAVGELAAGWIV